MELELELAMARAAREAELEAAATAAATAASEQEALRAAAKRAREEAADVRRRCGAAQAEAAALKAERAQLVPVEEARDMLLRAAEESGSAARAEAAAEIATLRAEMSALRQLLGETQAAASATAVTLSPRQPHNKQASKWGRRKKRVSRVGPASAGSECSAKAEDGPAKTRVCVIM